MPEVKEAVERVRPVDLQPRAETIRTFFPSLPNNSATSLNALPRQLQRLNQALRRDVIPAIEETRAETERQVSQALELNPNLTEEELVNMIGGSRVVTRRLLREQEGRNNAQRFRAETTREAITSGVFEQGPEAIREFLEDRMEPWFVSLPDDQDIRNGAREGLGDLVQQLVSQSVEAEASQIMRQSEQRLAEEARVGLLVDGYETTTENLRDRISAFEVGGLPEGAVNATIIDTYINHATENSNLFEGEEVLRALVDGDDPFIKDPQERARVADAIARVRRLQDTAKDASERGADEDDNRELNRAYTNIVSNFVAGLPLDGADFTTAVRLDGAPDAIRKVAAMRDKVNVIQSAFFLGEDEEARLRFAAVNGDIDREDILALQGVPLQFQLDLLETIQKGQPSSVRGTQSYKATIRILRDRLAKDINGLIGGDSALAVKSFDQQAVAMIQSRPELLQAANEGELTLELNQLQDKVLEALERGQVPQAVQGTGQALQEAVSEAQRLRRSALDERARARREMVDAIAGPTVPDPSEMGASTPLLEHYYGPDPVMQRFWAPDGRDYDGINYMKGAP